MSLSQMRIADCGLPNIRTWKVGMTTDSNDCMASKAVSLESLRGCHRAPRRKRGIFDWSAEGRTS
jgi:hypothetical protein